MTNTPDRPDTPERGELVDGPDMGGMPDMGDLLRQAMAMQEQLMAAQQEAQAATVEGQAGGGLVRITMTGGGEVTAVRLAPEAVDPANVAFLEDLVLAALHDATEKAQQLQAKAMGGLGDLGLGGLGGLLGQG